MDGITYLLIALIVLVIFLALIILRNTNKLKAKENKGDLESILLSLKAELTSQQMQGLVSLKKSLDDTGKNLNERLSEENQTLDRRLKIINDIQLNIGKLTEQATRLDVIGEDVKSLSDVLRPPKSRGRFGEILLENIIRDILPGKMISFQHGFKDGQRVDAAIKLSDRVLPIDSKFPLDSYQRIMEETNSAAEEKSAKKDFATAIKKHIDSVAKYIRPDEMTYDFALMYIPSEAVYNYLTGEFCQVEFDYALRKKIIPSSPGHLYGFLLTLRSVLSEISFSSNSREIVAMLHQVSEILKELSKYQDRLGGSLRSASQSLDKTEALTEEINKKLNHIQTVGLGETIEEDALSD